MDAIITVKFTLRNICDARDLREADMTFKDMVDVMLHEEGLFGMAEDAYEIISIEEATPQQKGDGR